MCEMSEGGRTRKVTYDVLVRNFPKDVTEKEIRELFDVYGHVESINALDDRRNEDRKFGYVRYTSEEDSHKAVAGGNVMLRGTYELQVLQTKGKDKRDTLNGPRGSNMEKNMSGGSAGSGRIFTNSSNQNKPDIVSNHQPSRTSGSSTMTKDANGSTKSRSQESVQQQMLVSHVEAPCVFYAQLPEDRQQIREMAEYLAMFCPSANPVQGQPQKSKSYSTQFSEDKQWYRCKVENYQGEHKSLVRYIDYGNCEVVSNSAMRELHPRCSTSKPFARRYILYGLASTYKEEEMGYQQGVSRLKECIETKMINATMMGRDNAYVKAEVNGQDINALVLEEGFARKRIPKNLRESGQNESGSHTKPNYDRQSSSGPKDSSSGNQNYQNQGRYGGGDSGSHARTGAPSGSERGHYGGKASFKITGSVSGDHWEHHDNGQVSSMFDGPQFHQQQQQQEGPTIDTWSSPLVKASKPLIPTPMFQKQAHTGPPPPLQDNSQYLQNELQEAMQEVSRLRNELALRHQEKKNGEQEMNDMVLERAKLKGEIRNLSQDCINKSQQLQEMSLNHRLKSLLVSVHRIKQLRQQFPTERQTRDNIEWAIELVKNNQGKLSINDLEVANKVKVAMEKYEAAQENIKVCVDMSVIDDLTEKRDEARKELHLVLVEFEDKVCHMPLEEKKAQLKDALSSLEATHGYFLKPTKMTQPQQFSETLEWYMSWKSKKTAEFRERRALTNACHNSLKSSLNLLQQELALDVEQSGESPLSAANLDDPLKKYNSAVYSEISATDIEKSDDAKFVTFILKFVVEEIHSELNEIDSLVNLRTKYSSMCEKISQWLEEKPDVTKLNKVRKTIKGLKSKLRHKLADKQDLEESDDSVGSELGRLDDDLREIRYELQVAFREEDQLLAELSSLSENHFPELSLQQPDMGIDREIEYEGLVKSNRSLEIFETHPLADCDKSSIMKSTFCGDPIILKEFIVDESIGVSRNEFLCRALAYHHLEHPSILPIHTIFFGNGKRNAYIQLPFQASSADNTIGKTTVTPLSLFNILHGVLEGLKCLHDAKIVHGSVHPQNVFIDSQGRGILAEFDFTKSLQQRAEREFVTKNGIRFIPPEVSSQKNTTRASDIYNFGLLALWMMGPSDHITLRTNGIPDLQKVRFEDQSLATFVQIVLNENPSARPTATDLLLFPYFVNEPKGEELRLQLRPKQPSPPMSERIHGGILKNSPTTPPPPLEGIVQVNQLSDTPTTPDREIASILGESMIQPPDIVTAALSLINDDAPPLEHIDDDQYSKFSPVKATPAEPENVPQPEAASGTVLEDADVSMTEESVEKSSPETVENPQTEITETASSESTSPVVSDTTEPKGVKLSATEGNASQDEDEISFKPVPQDESSVSGCLATPEINIEGPSPVPDNVPSKQTDDEANNAETVIAEEKPINGISENIEQGASA